MTVLTLYGKPGCHLCEEAREVVRAASAGREVELVEVDITLDPAVERGYRERIPVLELDGEELFELFVERDALEQRLDRVAS
jgi:glutaredoxin